MLLTATEVKDKYRITDETLTEWNKSGYLRPVPPTRGPGKHRLYYEEDITNLLEKPCSYKIRYDNYAKLPSRVDIIGHIDVGSPTAWTGDITPDMPFCKVEMGIFKRHNGITMHSVPGTLEFVIGDLNILLQHPKGMDETGIISTLQVPDRYTPYVSDEDRIILKTSDMWKVTYPLKSKQSRTPDCFWSEEVVNHKTHKEIIKVLYTLERKI